MDLDERSTQGIIVFDTAEDEHVVSVEHIATTGRAARTGTAVSA
jgi:orotate phosphoribosyltransferase